MISNRNYNTDTARRIPVRRISLLSPREGASYMHHSQIVHYKGKFYVTFSLGEVNEDDCRQKVMLSVSDDGVHFSRPEVIFSGEEAGNPEAVTAAAPIYLDEETGKLVFTFGYVEWDPDYIVNGHRKNNSDYGLCNGRGYLKTFDGASFSPAAEARVGYLEKLAEGRYISSGGGTTVWLADNQKGENARMVSIIGLTEGEMTTGDVQLRVAERCAELGAPYFLCETQYWYHGDGKVVLFIRPDKYNPQYAYDRFKGSAIMEKAIPLSTENYYFSAVSLDYGETWDIPRQTEFYCDISLTATGRLPDGRFYYVGNEDGHRLYRRDPLVLSLSEDGENFTDHYIIAENGQGERFRGINKGGAFAYPHVIIVGEYMYISYTIYKEEIAIARIALKDLK